MKPSSVLETQWQRAAELFQERFGRRPQFAAAAPGRVNLIGEHTDYNGGFVLPIAIERWTLMVADRTASGRVNLASTAMKERASFDLDRLETGSPGWANYVAGVLDGCAQRGLAPGGFDALIDSQVPVGGGLSSSAALEVAAATLVEAMTGGELDRIEKALLCQRAEHKFAGVPCGIMDQFICTMAQPDHAMLLDCRSQDMKMVPMMDRSVTVLIINSNVRHDLATGEYAARRRQCGQAAKALGVAELRDATAGQLTHGAAGLDPLLRRRARHVIHENDRTERAAQTIAAGDWAATGRLMSESHASLRQDYEVSCRELDLLVESACQLSGPAGAFGARMTGGGFGGCTVNLIRADRVDQIATHICQHYQQQAGITATAFATRPAGGACVLDCS